MTILRDINLSPLRTGITVGYHGQTGFRPKRMACQQRCRFEILNKIHRLASGVRYFSRGFTGKTISSVPRLVLIIGITTYCVQNI